MLAAGPSLARDEWETQDSWYDPARYVANFIVLARSSPSVRPYPWITSVTATFGQPASVTNVGRYTIMMWNRNVLARLPR